MKSQSSRQHEEPNGNGKAGQCFARVLAYAALICGALLYGLLACKFQLFPYAHLKAAYQFLSASEPVLTATYEDYLDTDVSQLITIRTSDDVANLRHQLLQFLWGKPALPAILPTAVMHDVKDSSFMDIPSLLRIDALRIEMDFGILSHAYHLIPRTPNARVILYHHGHDGDFILGKEQIKTLLDQGYAVIAFAMPLVGRNNQPTIDFPRVGKLRLTSHDHMKFLTPTSGHPVKYFVEPVIAALNYIEATHGIATVSMIGISGGGWTTTLAAAIDTRIKKSFPVAGSYPLFLASNAPRDWGDFEQTVPELYQLINHLELYVLGAHGNGRRQLQIINQHDPCCYGGTKWKTYDQIVANRVQALSSGEFSVFLDEKNTRHTISKLAIKRILDEINSTPLI